MPIWVGFALFIVVGIASYLIYMGNKSPQEAEAIKERRNKKIYFFLMKNFLTQKSMRVIHSKLSNLSVYKKEELYPLTTQYFLMSRGGAAAIMFFGFVLFNDFVSYMMIISLAILLSKTLVDKQIDKEHFNVIKSIGKALSMVRQGYMRTNSVVEAVNDAEIDDILKKPFDELYSILTAADGETRLQEFYASSPFRTLQTFFGICYNINNQGDTIDEYGQSNFVQALTVLSTDVNAEINRIITQQQKFGFLEYLPFAPIFAIPVIETYFSKIMPGTALIYGGPIGYIFKALTLFVAILSYGFISNVNRNVPIKENDQKEWVLSLLAKPKFAKFIDNLKPKNKKKRLLNYKLKRALSRQTIEEIYTQKVVMGGVTLFASLLILLSVVSIGSDYIRNSTQQLSLVATDEMEAFSKESILELDQKYFDERLALVPKKTLGEEVTEKVQGIQRMVGLLPKQENATEEYPELQEESVKAMVSSYLPGLTDLQIIDQVKRLQDKFSTVMSTRFHWWFVWIAFGIAAIGWNFPNIQLKLRRTLANTEAENDFLQLQTLVSILMATNLDTLDVLYELSQHSRIHKEMLTYCYHSFPANPELELSRLQAKTPLEDFKVFIGKLKLTVDDLSLREAFADLIIEREQIMRIREISINTAIDRKRSLAGIMALIPLGVMVLGELMVPLGYLGYQEFMNAITMM